MIKKQLSASNLSLILAICFGIILLVFYFGDNIIRLNTVYFNGTGDGIKNYYTAEYHAKHDDNLFRFNGMNYPEGEHVMFTDGFFPIVAFIKILKPLVNLTDYTHGIINGVIVFSFLIAVFFLFKVFRELKINDWVSAIAAPLLVFLSPQVMRVPGHYSLSLMFFIPLLIYLLLKFYRHKRWKYIIWAGVTVFLCSLCHLYYFALGGVLVGGAVFYLVLFDRKNISILHSVKFLFFAVILPYIFIFLLMKISDSVTDRSAYPYGFLVYKSEWEGLFLKDANIEWQWLKSFLKPDPVEWEGWSFIGHAGIFGYLFAFSLFASLPFLLDTHLAAFFTVLIAGLLIWVFLKRKMKLYNLSDNPIMNALLWSGFIAMFVSFAFPVNVFPDLYYHIGPIRELRGIGRMAWIFYFTVNIGLLYIVQNFIKKKNLRIILFAAVLIIMGCDMHKQNRVYLLPLGEGNSISEMKADIDKIPLNPDSLSNQYQAILTIPSFLVGSENINNIPENEDALAYSLLLSQKSGLPVVSSFMSRTSMSQTIRKTAFFYGPYNKPDEYLQSINSNKNFLIVSVPPLRPLLYGEELILKNSDTLWKHERFMICSINIDTLKKLYAIGSQDDSLLSAAAPLLWQDFSEGNNSSGYFTAGTSPLLDLKQPVLAAELPLNYKPDSSIEAEISFWYSDISQDGLLRGSCEIVFLDSDNNVIGYDLENLYRNMRQIDGTWGLYVRNILIPAEARSMRISLIHYELKINIITIDNILVRAVNDDIIMRGETWYMKNNYFYKKIK